MNTTINAEQLHARLLHMVKQFHQFCAENGLRYYMLGGTCLGAKRHGGFIPWDDDLDIGMPREDYDRLYILQNDLPQNLELRFYKNTTNSPMHYIKLIDNTTTLIEPRYPNYVEGLYIDVFPLDYASRSSDTKELLRWKTIWLLQGLIIYHCMHDSPENSLKKLVFWGSKILNLTALHTLLESLMIKKKQGENVANFLGAWQKKEIMDKSIFGEPTLYPFEDTELYGPEKIESYLNHLYGDFEVLPPIEQRVFKHEYLYLNFSLPYKEFLRRSNDKKYAIHEDHN